MRPEDLQTLNLPSDIRLSPDGQRVAFVVSTPNLDDDRYERRIHIDEEAFTSGPGDSMPRWSPDGDTLAFVTTAEEGVAEVRTIRVGGGEATTIARFDLGVSEMEWMPDSNTLAVVAATYIEEWADLTDEERSRRPRTIKRVPFRFDGLGWVDDRRRHIWLVSEDSEPRQLTDGEFDETVIAVSPDGDSIAFTSNTGSQPGLKGGNEIWEVDVASGERTELATTGFWQALSYSPTGAIHAIGSVHSEFPQVYPLHRVDEEGATPLTGHLDRSNASLAAGPPAIRWAGDDPVVGFEDSGGFGLVRVKNDGSVDHLVAADSKVVSFDVHGDIVFYAASTPTDPGTIFENKTPVVDLNPKPPTLIAPDHFRVQSGDTEIDTWVYLPQGDESVPLLLNIHGGPASQYGFGFFDEFQVYAGAGYGVVACNPRGSSGRGEDFLKAVKGDGWGEVDLEDIRNVVAAALDRHSRLDPERLGIMGGSYGGFLTAWITGHEDRWKSAVVERALVSWPSFAGTSDIGGRFPDNYLETSYPEAWAKWWEKSPLALAHKVDTPTLIVHSEGDYRCPVEQAEQYFMALLRNGTPTEFLRFPGGSHELSRSGKPKHRVERFNAILDWHAEYLK